MICVIRQTDKVFFVIPSLTSLSVAVIKQIQVSRMEWILCDVIYVTDMLRDWPFYERGQIWKIVLNSRNLCKKKKAGSLEVQVSKQCRKLHWIGFRGWAAREIKFSGRFDIQNVRIWKPL